MKRLDYFLLAMKAELFRNRAWVFSAFAVVQEGPEAYKADPYPFRIVQTPTAVLYVSPDDPTILIPLDDAKPGEAPFFIKERIQLKGNKNEAEGDCPNLMEDIESNYGNLLANFIAVVYPFGRKIPYLQGRFGAGVIEALVLPRLRDNNDPIAQQWKGEGRDIKWIYVDEYLKFTDAMSYIAVFSSLWVSGGTAKSLLPPPGIKEYRDKLIAQHKDHLTDPAVVAVIAKQLQEYDRKWLEGDESLNVMLSKKSFEVVRAKKFLMVGAEVGLNTGVEVDLIENSLDEGWDINKFPAMNNNLRAGSYNRGAQTMLGGESVKWLLRGSSNINIVKGDCGTQLGKRVKLSKDRLKRYVGFTIIDGAATQVLTEDVIDKYLDKVVYVRTPLYCKQSHTDYCSVCVGPRLADNPTGASSAIADYGSAMLLVMMKAMHGKQLTLAKYNYRDRLL